MCYNVKNSSAPNGMNAGKGCLEVSKLSDGRLEHALEGIDATCETFLETISDGVYLLDKDGCFTYVNKIIQERSGIPFDKLVGMRGLDIVNPEDHKHVQMLFERVMRGEEVPPYELSYRTSQGGTNYVELNSRAIFRGKEIVGIQGVSRDITRRKRAEMALEKLNSELESRVKKRTDDLEEANRKLVKEIESRKRTEMALRESERRFRAIFDSAQDCIFMKDEELRYTLVNPCMERLFGVSASKMIGETDKRLFGAEAFFHSAEVDTQVLGGEVFEEEDTRPVKGVPTTFHVIKVPMYDRSERVSGLCGIARNITGRKKAEDALRHSEMTTRALLNATTEVIMLIDKDGPVLALNETAARRFGKGVAEARGLNIADLVEPEVFKRRRRLAEPAFESGKPVRFQDERNGRIFDTNIYPVVDGKGEVIQLAVFARDITAEKETERKLLSHQHKLRSLASELSLAEERQRRGIANEVHDHIGQNLAFAKIKLGELRRQNTSKDFLNPIGEITSLIDRTIQDTRELVSELGSPVLYELGFVPAVQGFCRKIEKRYDLVVAFKDDNRPKLLADDVQVLLFQSFREILLNVVKHAEAKNANVSLSRDGDHVLICVSDDGDGFEVADLDSKVHDKKSFGLFSIQERLEPIGGGMQIESKRGQGTLVTLTAPLGEEIYTLNNP